MPYRMSRQNVFIMSSFQIEDFRFKISDCSGALLLSAQNLQSEIFNQKFFIHVSTPPTDRSSLPEAPGCNKQPTPLPPKAKPASYKSPDQLLRRQTTNSAITSSM